jgi:hypothetical protein
MSDAHEHILARLNLKAILPSLAALVRLDNDAQSLVAGQHFGVQLKTCSGLACRLDFLDGEVEENAARAGHQALKLLFLTDRQLNKTFSGSGFSLPIPVGGYGHLARLRTFTKLTTRLRQVLEASPRQLVEEKLLETHTDLLMGELIPSAIVQLASFDVPCRRWLAPFANTSAQFEVVGGTSSWLRFENSGAVHCSGAPEMLPDVIISFRDRHVALAAIHGNLDHLGAVGKGEMTVRGLIPLADTLGRVLDRLGFFLDEVR